MVTNTTRRRLHGWLAIFFAIQMPLAVWLYSLQPKWFTEGPGFLYLILVSQWALVASHWAAKEADTD